MIPTEAANVTPLVHDELQALASMLCARFPECSRVDVERLVTDVHHRLSENARIRSHLIPLTLNRCRQVLSLGAGSKGLGGNDFCPQTVTESADSVDLVDAAI